MSSSKHRLAIIPARGGSKRIPRKNIRDFHGKPIIAYSIITAINSGLFDEVMVSTDDEEISAISKQYGASVPFLRSPDTSDDSANTADVMREVILKYKELGCQLDYVCCLYPCAPFITTLRLKEAYLKFSNEGYDAVFSVVRFDYPIQRALKMDKGCIEMFSPEFFHKRSQDLIPAFHDAGQFCFFYPESFLGRDKIWTENTSAIEVSELEAQDIDHEADWHLAELKYNLFKDLNEEEN